jgi:hypothetical protein
MWVQSNTEHGVWLQATGEAEAEPLYISLADANKTLEVWRRKTRTSSTHKGFRYTDSNTRNETDSLGVGVHSQAAQNADEYKCITLPPLRVATFPGECAVVPVMEKGILSLHVTTSHATLPPVMTGHTACRWACHPCCILRTPLKPYW